MVSLDEVADAWCSYHSREHPPGDEGLDDPDSWALEFWQMRDVEDNPSLERDFVEALLRRAGSDPRLCGAIGAGPLEDLLPQADGDFLWLERLAAELPGTRIAVGTMWVDEWLDANQMARLDRIAGRLLARSRRE